LHRGRRSSRRSRPRLPPRQASSPSCCGPNEEAAQCARSTDRRACTPALLEKADLSNQSWPASEYRDNVAIVLKSIALVVRPALFGLLVYLFLRSVDLFRFLIWFVVYSSRASNPALPPAAAVLTVIVCSVAKRRR